MKNKESFKDNYKVQGLVDLDKLNGMVMDFKDKLWIKRIIQKTFKISDSRPSVKSIEKIQVSVKNIYSQIVTMSEGNMLLVQGILCQSVSYVSNTFPKVVCEINGYTNFSDYIRIDEDINIDKDKFDIYPCIENLSATVLNERNILINSILYLFANKINSSTLPPTPKKMFNKIILNSKSNEKVLEIDFDKDEQKIIVTPTEIKPNHLLKGVEYFKFILRDRFGNEVVKASVNTDQNAQIFSDIINNQEFAFTDSIELIGSEIGSIEILNYPNLNEIYILKNIKEKFIITNKGLIEYLYPNKIIINNDNKEEVSKVEFNIKKSLLKVTSTGIQSTKKFEANQEYLALILLDENLNIKNQGDIKGKRTASIFQNNLNDKTFNNGDIIKLRYKNKENIDITNYKCKRKYNPEQKFEFFTITEDNLISYELSFLNQFIRLKNKDNSSIIDIFFSNDKQILVMDSTGIKSVNSNSFSLKLMDWSQKYEKCSFVLYKGQNADKMVKSLDNKKFQYGDVMELIYSDNTLVQIINYPTLNSVYNPIMDSEKFIITPKGLISFVLPNRIIVKNKNNQIVATIFFCIRDMRLKVDSTDNVADPNLGNGIYFSLELISKQMFIKELEVIKGEQNGKNFAEALDEQVIEEDDIIRLTFANPNNIDITNYPNLEDGVYIPKDKEESFIIDSGGLKSHPKILKNVIYLNTDAQVAIIIGFNIDENKLIVNSINDITFCPGFGPYLVFEIFREGRSILSESIGCNKTVKPFVQKLNGFEFKYNDEISFSLISPNKAIIKNFNELGKELRTSKQRLIITSSGLRIKQ